MANLDVSTDPATEVSADRSLAAAHPLTPPLSVSDAVCPAESPVSSPRVVSGDEYGDDTAASAACAQVLSSTSSLPSKPTISSQLTSSSSSSALKLARSGCNKPPDFVVKLYVMFQEVPSLIKWDAGKIVIPGPSSRLGVVLSNYFRTGAFQRLQLASID